MILDRKRPENECSQRSLPKKKGRERRRHRFFLSACWLAHQVKHRTGSRSCYSAFHQCVKLKIARIGKKVFVCAPYCDGDWMGWRKAKNFNLCLFTKLTRDTVELPFLPFFRGLEWRKRRGDTTARLDDRSVGGAERKS